MIARVGRYLQVGGAAALLARVSVPVAVGLSAVAWVASQRARRWNRTRLAAVRGNAASGRASRYTSGLANWG